MAYHSTARFLRLDEQKNVPAAVGQERQRERKQQSAAGAADDRAPAAPAAARSWLLVSSRRKEATSTTRGTPAVGMFATQQQQQHQQHAAERSCVHDCCHGDDDQNDTTGDRENNNTIQLDAEVPPPNMMYADDDNNEILVTNDNNDPSRVDASATTTDPTKHVWIGRLMVMGAAAMYGSNFVIVKHLHDGESVPSGVAAALRFSWAALVVSAVTLVRERHQRRNNNDNKYAYEFSCYECSSSSSSQTTTAATTTTATIMSHHNQHLHEESAPPQQQHQQQQQQQHEQQQQQQQQLQQQQQQQQQQLWPSTVRGLEVGGWYCIGYISQAVALQTVDAGKCAFFSALTVIIVPLLDAGYKRISLSRRALVSILCAVAGVGILELGEGNGSAGAIVQTGDWLSLIMALTFAVGYWRLADVARQYPTMANRVTMGQLLAVAIGAIGYGIIEQYWVHPYENGLRSLIRQVVRPAVLAQLAWSGLGPTALAVYLETIALRAITASELTLLMTSTSLWAAFFAYLVLGEVLSRPSMMGGGLILLACIVYALGGQDPKQNNT
jgi:drug/metabolite transporter (DMT)-like permease